MNHFQFPPSPLLARLERKAQSAEAFTEEVPVILIIHIVNIILPCTPFHLPHSSIPPFLPPCQFHLPQDFLEPGEKVPRLARDWFHAVAPGEETMETKEAEGQGAEVAMEKAAPAHGSVAYFR